MRAAVSGSSSWATPLRVGIKGSSSWGVSIRSAFAANSVWLKKTTADSIGTGGLYTRPSGVPSPGISRFIKPLPKITVWLSGSEIPARKGRIRIPRNNPTEWEIELDRIGLYGPTSNVATACRTRSATWTIRIEIGGERWEFRNLVAYDYEAESDEVVKIVGTDISERLNYKRHQPDVDCVSTIELFAALSEFGVTVVSEGYQEKIDYYHRIGKPIEWLRDWTYPLADWSVENGVIVVRPVEYGKTPRWNFVEREDLEFLRYKATPWAIRNKAVVQKEAGGEGIVLEVNESAQSMFEPGFFGMKGPYQFKYPATHVRAQVVRAERGHLKNFTFDAADGHATSGAEATSGQYAGTRPATAVRFSYDPGSPDVFTWGAFIPAFHVIFYGTSAERAQRGAGGSGEWKKTWPVAGGIVQEYEEPFVFQHFTDKVGQRLADALAYEGALRGESLNWETEISPWIRSGFNVGLTERRVTGYVKKLVFLQAVEHTWDHTLTVNESTGQTEIADSGTTLYDGSALLTAA